MHKIRFFPDTITVLQIKREEADTMILKEKERTTIQDLQTQEKSCIEKYGRYAQQAKDPELKNLFQTLQQKEREHYESLDRVLVKHLCMILLFYLNVCKQFAHTTVTESKHF